MAGSNNPQPPADSGRGLGMPPEVTPEQTPEWSAKLIRLGHRKGVIPIYGSHEWHQLEPTDPRKFASVVRAAEAWRQDGTDEAIATRLHAEFADNDRLAAWRLRQMSHDLSAGLDWRAQAQQPSFDELQQRRAAQGAT